MFGNIIIETLRCFDFRDDRTSWFDGQDVTRIEDQETIPPQDIPLLVHGSDSICITVIPDSYIGLTLFHSLHQVGEIFEHGRVRMVVGEPTVEIAIQTGNLASEQFKRIFGDQCRGTVSTINHDMESIGFDMRKAFFNVG